MNNQALTKAINIQAIYLQAMNNHPSADKVKDQLSDILNNWEFKKYQQGDTLQELLIKFLNWLGLSEKTGSNFDLGQGAISLVLIIIGVILISYLLRHIAPFWRIMTPDIAMGESETELGVPLVPQSLFKKAQEMAQGQQFRDALRYLYLALLLELDENRVISYQNAKTNHEYLKEVNSKARHLMRDFGEMMDLFEHKWYGLEECTYDDYRSGLNLYQALTKEGA